MGSSKHSSDERSDIGDFDLPKNTGFRGAGHRAHIRATRNDEEKLEQNQQNCPTGKSLPIYRNRVKPENRKE